MEQSAISPGKTVNDGAKGRMTSQIGRTLRCTPLRNRPKVINPMQRFFKSRLQLSDLQCHSFISAILWQGRSQEGGAGDPWRLGLRHKPRGGFASRANLLALPPAGYGAEPQRGLGRSPSGGLGAEPPVVRSCGEAAPGFGAEPQAPRVPGPPLLAAALPEDRRDKRMTL